MYCKNVGLRFLNMPSSVIFAERKLKKRKYLANQERRWVTG